MTQQHHKYGIMANYNSGSGGTGSFPKFGGHHEEPYRMGNSTLAKNYHDRLFHAQDGKMPAWHELIFGSPGKNVDTGS